MKRYIYIILMFCGVLVSCNEREIEVFGTEHDVYFEKFFINAFYPGTEQADSTAVSFFFSPDDQEYIYADLVVCLSGRRLTSNVSFSLKVVPESTTAIPSEYKLDDNYAFRVLETDKDAKYFTDTLHVKMLRSSRLKDIPEGVCLTVEIVPNSNMGVGQFERSRARIILTENSVRPLWWTNEVEVFLLGNYSEKKYKLFLQNVKDAINLNGRLIKEQPDQAIKMVREFKMWLSIQDPQVLEKDGSVMSVNI